MKKVSVLFAVLIAFCTIGFAGSGELLTNEDIITLAENQSLTDDVRIKMIKIAPETDFKITPEAISDLAAAGVSNAVITAMLEKKSYKSAPAGQTSSAENAKEESTTPEAAYKWENLELDVSTPEDVIAIMGAPVDDTMSGLEVFKIKSRFPGQQADSFRKLVFKPEAGKFKSVEAYFRGEQLVKLDLEFRNDNQPEPLGFPSAFGNELKFKAFFSGWDEGFSPDDFERLGGDVSAINFPPDYAIVAETPRSIVNGVVKKPRKDLFTKDLGSKILGKRDRGWPGKVRAVQLISRSLEPRANLAQN